ncbi:hypothetical protein SSOG_01597 [Streptomyces himastatinicus ATCC 53653]|uniref:Uncharacterized protein n=1 Tax=Streptomyces himastatinicus ATCC 53653 TaxID=457427 RepID=D9WPM0_9ACTN|nr:hypothetical protein SSOG_01597 [Streptomyces himastatinicus ATCC 53653]
MSEAARSGPPPQREGKSVRMEIVTTLGAGFLVLAYVLDQLPALSDKACRALQALRRLHDEWHRPTRDSD